MGGGGGGARRWGGGSVTIPHSNTCRPLLVYYLHINHHNSLLSTAHYNNDEYSVGANALQRTLRAERR